MRFHCIFCPAQNKAFVEVVYNLRFDCCNFCVAQVSFSLKLSSSPMPFSFSFQLEDVCICKMHHCKYVSFTVYLQDACVIYCCYFIVLAFASCVTISYLSSSCKVLTTHTKRWHITNIRCEIFLWLPWIKDSLKSNFSQGCVSNNEHWVIQCWCVHNSAIPSAL